MTKEEKNPWKEAFLDMFDRLGAESWPYVECTPTEVSNALYKHVLWLEEHGRNTLKFNLIKDLIKGNESLLKKGVLEEMLMELRKKQ